MDIDGGFTRQVSDVLDVLGTGMYCNTFSNREKKQIAEVQKFKEVIGVLENEERYRLLCRRLVCDIGSCVAAPKKSVDARKEKS